MNYFFMWILLTAMAVLGPSGSHADDSIQLRQRLSHLEQQFMYEKQQYYRLRHQDERGPRPSQTTRQVSRQGTCIQSPSGEGSSRMRKQQEMKLRKISMEMQSIQRKLHTAIKSAKKNNQEI